MKRSKRVCFLLSILLLLVTCKIEKNDPDEVKPVLSFAKKEMIHFTIKENKETESFNVWLNVSGSMSEKMRIELALDEAYIEEYNKTHKTDNKILPEKYFSFTKTVETTKSSIPFSVELKSSLIADELFQDKQSSAYLISLSIVKNNSALIGENSRQLIKVVMPQRDFDKGETFRLVSYNIAYCRSNVKEEFGYTTQNMQRVADAITALDGDLVSLQELDRHFPGRLNGRFLLKDLSEATGRKYKYYYGCADTTTYAPGDVGVGVLINERLQPIQVKVVPVFGQTEGRVLLMLEFRSFWFVALHFDHINAENQVKSVEVLLKEMIDIEKPLFLAGDFNNFDRSSPLFNLLYTKFDIISVIKSSFGDDKVIDYIMCTKGASSFFKVLDSDMPQTIRFQGEEINLNHVSDHFPVWVDLEVK